METQMAEMKKILTKALKGKNINNTLEGSNPIPTPTTNVIEVSLGVRHVQTQNQNP